MQFLQLILSAIRISRQVEKLIPVFTSPGKLADAGFGLWYDEVLTTSEFLTAGLLPENFNSIDALRIIGYDVSDSSAAIQSFKVHFIQREIESPMSDLDRLILYNLYKKYR